MECDKDNVPDYLHWNNRKIYSARSFCYFHRLYRIKKKDNPIKIPEEWITSISCKWSKLIKERDIILEHDRVLGDDYDFVYVKRVKKYRLIKALSDPNHPHMGIHILTCDLVHSPTPCDYSHSEILIRHRAYKNNINEAPFLNECYTHDAWENKTAFLKKQKGDFFKQLKKDFRTDMIRLISVKSEQNNLLRNATHLIKCLP